MKNSSFRRVLTAYPEFWFLLVLTLLLFPFRQIIAGAGVYELSQAGTIGAWRPIFLGSLGVLVFLLPGMGLVVIVGDEGDWRERLALAFVASIASLGIFAEAATVLHTSIEFMVWAYLGLTLVAVAGAFLRLFIFPPSSQDSAQADRPPLWMWAILIVMVAIVMLFSVDARMDPDEIDMASYVQNIRHDQHIMVTEPKLNGNFGLSARFYMDTWLVDQGLMSRITGQDPLDQYKAIDPALTLIMLAAFYAFARRMTDRKRAAVIATIGWTLYLIVSNHDSVAGYEVMIRPNLDKVIAGFIIVPVGIGVLKSIFDHHRRRDWFWLGVTALAAMLTHPLAIGLFGLSIAGWGITELITHRNWQTLWRLAAAAIILTVALTPDLVALAVLETRSSAVGGAGAGGLAVTLTDTRDPSLAQELRTQFLLERLYVLPNAQYIMSPKLVFQPFFIPAFVALPILFWQSRRSRGARMLFGMLTVLTLAIIFPPTAVLLGRLVTPWIFYRMHWPIGLAALVTVGWGLDWLYTRLETGTLPRFKPSIPKYGLAATGLAVWLFFMAANASYVQTNLGFEYDTQMNPTKNCVWSNDLLRPFQQLAPNDTMVLGDLYVNACLVGAAPYAGVMEYRLPSTVRPYKHGGTEQKGWDRLSDFAYFQTTNVVDQRLLQIIDTWKIKFVVVAQNRLLDGQMRHMPGMFQPLYTADFQTVYKVLSTNQEDSIVQANSMLSEYRFTDAASAFEKLQSADSADTRYLAQIGLGYAYQQLGRVDDALAIWGQAAGSTKEGDPLALRAQLFGMRGQYDLGIEAYQEAIAREPDNQDWPIALGTDLYRAHRVDEATATLEAGVGKQVVPGSASYHQMLGNIWMGLNEYDRAAEEYKKSVAMTADPNVFATLATTYISGRRIPQAQALLNQMANQDSWDADVPFLRGQIQALSGNWKSTADLTRQSLKLNPLYPNGYDSLANAITMQDGTRGALDQLEQLPGYRTLGFGDTFLTVATLEAGMGQFDQANKDLAKAFVWDETNRDYWEAQGDVQLAMGNFDAAAAKYSKVIQADPSPQAAYLSLSQIAHTNGNLALEQGYLIQSINAQPNSPSAQVALGDFFLRQAQPALAQRQYQIALDTQPFDPSVLTAVGDFHANRGEFDQALGYYQKALARNSASSGAYLGMSSVYTDQGKVAEATDAIDRAVKATPGAAAPRSALAALDSAQGNSDAALQELKQVIKQNPGFTPAYAGLTKQYMAQGQSAEAQSLLEDVAAGFPTFDGGYVGLGLLAERRGDFAAAESSYRQGIATVAPTQSGSALLSLADLQSRQGKRDQALQSIQSAIKQEPTLTSAYIDLANMYAHDGDYSKATNAVKQGLALAPGSADLNARLGDLELAQGHVADAAQIYDNYLKLYPGAFSITIDKANLLAAMGQPDAALTQVTQLAQQWSGVPAVISAQASLEATNGKPQAALDTAKKLTALVPGDSQSWVALGNASAGLGRYQDAEAALRRATSVQPGDGSSWLSLGQFLALENQIDPATSALAKSIQVDQSKTDPHIALGSIYERQGKQSDAVGEYSKAAGLDAGADQGLLALGQLSQTAGKQDEAQRYVQQAVASSPADPQAYAARAGLFLQAGQADQARQTLEQATKTAPGACQAYQNLGAFYASRGDFSSAQSNYSQALAVSGCPSSVHVARAGVDLVQAKTGDAIGEYQQAIAAVPGAAAPYVGLAQTYAQQGRVNDATTLYVQAASRVPASDLLSLGNGMALIQQGNFQQGFDLMVKATTLRPASSQDLVALGRAYQIVGQNDNAEKTLQRAAGTDASAADPHLALGDLYTRMARFDEALAQYNKAIELAPGNPQTYQQLGQYYQSRGQYDQAVSAYQTAAKADQNQVGPLLALGQLYLKLDRFDEAERLFKQALATPNAGTVLVPDPAQPWQQAEAPASAQALLSLGELYLAKADPSQAEAAFKDAVRVAPASPDAYVRLARYYETQNRYDEARAQVEAAIKVDPTSSSAYVALGEIKQANLDWKGAEQSYTRASQVEPINADGLIHLGQLYLRQGRQSDAIAQFDAATKAAPASVPAWIALGDGQRSLARFDQAEQAYKQAVALVPGDPPGYISLGEFYQSRGNVSASLSQFQAAVKVAPSSPDAYVALGQLQQSQVKWSEAEDAFRQAIAMSPADPAGYIQLAGLYKLQAKPDAALLWLQSAVKAAPGAPEAQLALGQWYESRVDWAAAETAYKQAAALNSVDPTPYLGLARVYQAQARSADSLGQIQSATKAAPAVPDGYLALAGWYDTRANFQDAEAQYRQAIQVAPADPRAYLNLADLYRREGKNQDALSKMQAAATAAPASADPWVAQGDLLQWQQKWEDSKSAFRRAIELAPTAGSAYKGLGAVDELRGDTSSAVQDYQQGIAAVPADPLSRIHLGDLYQSLGKAKDAGGQFEGAVQVMPGSAAANVALGTWQQEQANFSAAEKALNQAVQGEPANAGAYTALGIFYSDQARFSDAESLLKTAQSRMPGNADLAIALGGYYLGRGRADLGLGLTRTAASLEPGNPKAWIAQAQGLASQVQFAGAEQAFNSAINAAPGLTDGYDALGDYQVTRENWDAAAKAYRQALAIQPIDEKANTGLVDINLRQGQHQDTLQAAVGDAEHWVQIAPSGQAAAWNLLGEVKRVSGDLVGSESAYQTALTRFPGNVPAAVGLSETYRAQGRFAVAVRVLSQALTVRPIDLDAHLNLGMTQEALGQMDAASSSYQVASADNPASAAALVVLGQFAVGNAQTDQGVQYYQKAMAMQPTAPRPYIQLAGLYNTQSNTDGALSTMQQAVNLIPNDLDLRLQLSQAYEYKQDETSALNTLHNALPLFPYQQQYTWTQMGSIYSAFGDSQSALNAFASAQKIDPTYTYAYIGQGDVYRDLMHDFDKATQAYQQAASVDGTNPVVYQRILSAYQLHATRVTGTAASVPCPNAAGNPSGCRGDVQNAVQNVKANQDCLSVGVSQGVSWGGVPPGQGIQTFFVECTSVYNGLDPNLLAQYQSNAAANPNSESAQVGLAMMYQGWHMDDQAIATWQRVLKIDPGSTSANYVLSEDYSHKEEHRVDSARSMGQAMALGVEDQAAFTRLAQLFGDHISSPVDGASLSGRVTISGTATGQNTGGRGPFSYYKIEVGAGTHPQAWTMISRSSTPVTNGTLATWDTTTWPDGTFTVRLMVVDATGNYQPWDSITVDVNNKGRQP